MLAYPAMNFVIYIFWWHKPLNVNQPVQMSQKLDPRATMVAAGLNLMVQKNLSWPLVKEQVLETQTWETTFQVIVIFIIGNWDQDVNLGHKANVPMFGANGANEALWVFTAGEARFCHLQNPVKTHCSCLNLALHFTSSETPIFNKGFACNNVHWNLYIVFIAIHYVLHCILPCAEHVQHLMSGHMQNFWFYFEFCSQHLPSCYTWKMTNGFCIM